MAKLVDALPSGGSVRKDVQVRILFWARASLFIRGGFVFLPYLLMMIHAYAWKILTRCFMIDPVRAVLLIKKMQKISV